MVKVWPCRGWGVGYASTILLRQISNLTQISYARYTLAATGNICCQLQFLSRFPSHIVWNYYLHPSVIYAWVGMMYAVIHTMTLCMSWLKQWCKLYLRAISSENVVEELLLWVIIVYCVLASFTYYNRVCSYITWGKLEMLEKIRLNSCAIWEVSELRGIP